MLVAITFCGLILIWGGSPALPEGGWSGISVMDAQGGILAASLALTVCALPALLAALGISMWACVATGAFTLAASLGVFAWYGGPIDGLLFRANPLKQVFIDLAIETLGWIFLWSVMMLLAGILHNAVRKPTARPHGSVGGTLSAGAICAVVGAVTANLLAKSTDPGQVVGALTLGFMLGGMVARSSVPSTRPWGLILSPLVVALGTYLAVWMSFTSDIMLERSWFEGRLTGLALMLPIYYASAGVAGAAMGFGLGRKVRT
ncbi:hypothetical protein Pan265_23280 [Mucisphaera calidilacus]|uniref:Uncharacterized protein n=2 Tax=Mucisphaera calidilacus TaxID=2527982 RepID=A0A518BZR1_9BACT|nr:hypothetical protein Pan265_23280 [Mucisphaera calidilacus]